MYIYISQTSPSACFLPSNPKEAECQETSDNALGLGLFPSKSIEEGPPGAFSLC